MPTKPLTVQAIRDAVAIRTAPRGELQRFADDVGVLRPHLLRFARGERWLGPEAFDRVVEALGMTVRWRQP